MNQTPNGGPGAVPVLGRRCGATHSTHRYQCEKVEGHLGRHLHGMAEWSDPYKPTPGTSPRPWHVDLGFYGQPSAVVDIEGNLVCDCEPRGETTAAENARLIVEAVNAYAYKPQT